MAHSSIQESLAARLEEIDAALQPFRSLIEERQRIEAMLEFYRERTDNAPSRPRSASKVSALLTRSREVLRGEMKHELPFLELFSRMPADVLGEGRHVREHFGGMLQRSGEKYGIEYVNADCVRLLIEEEAPTPASAPPT